MARSRNTKLAENVEDGSRWSLPAHQARSRETRDKLLAAAERVFDEKGYGGSRIIDIAKAAGCSVGAVYMRFIDKEALFNGIVEEFTSIGVMRVTEAASVATGDPAELIRAFIRGTTKQFTHRRGMFRAIIERGFEDPTALAPIMTMRTRLEAVLENALSATISRKHRDPRLAVRVATQMIFGFLLNSTINPFAPTKSDGPRANAELEKAVLEYLGLDEKREHA